MKRKLILLIGCVLLAIQAIAQTENKKEVFTKEKKTTEVKPINKPIQPIGVDSKLMLPELKEPKTSFDTTTNSLRIKLPPLYYGHSAIFPLYKRVFFYLEGEQKQYLNLASYNLAYFAMGLRLNSKLNLTGGLLAVKQFTNRSPYGIDRSGARLNLNYSITNQLDFNIWGQYLTGSSLNSPVDVMLPQTGTGASMVLNLGGGSHFGVGAEYQRDEKKEQWNYNAGGKLKLNF